MDDELRQAVEAFRRVTPDVLPAGALRAIRVEDGDASPVLTASVQAGERVLDVRLRDTSVLALLVRFCLENNVPIPKRGNKAVRLVDGLLTLVIDYGSDATL
ncbi:MAG: hypothetical protein JOY63_06310 [Acetobacteraceae bacterium]|nr:hypothetical protein [Acetobacteraceae bacterium]